MSARLDRFDRIISEAQDRIARQAAKVAALGVDGRDATAAARRLTGMRLDLAIYRQSRATVAASLRMLGDWV